MSKKVLKVWTDGATPNNQSKGDKVGGAGVFFGNDDPRNISLKLKSDKVTNQTCELIACIKALESILATEKIEKINIIVNTDSMYIVNTINNWAKKWEKNNWKKADGKPVQNLELVSKLYYLSINTNAKFKHVYAHKAKPDEDSKEYEDWYGNYQADALAVQAARKQ